MNNQSNGLPYGVAIYEGETGGSIFIEEENGYRKLVSTDLNNWNDGVRMKVDNYKLVLP